MQPKPVVALVFAFLATPALAQQPSCVPPLTPQLRIELYFGMGVAGRRPVSGREWARFVTHELTHRFPGLTVLDARGAWRNGDREVHERSKVAVIVTQESPATREAVARAAEVYKQRFHQQSVGIVTQTVCAAF